MSNQFRLRNLITVLLIAVGWSGLSAPPGAYRPPLATIGNPNPYFRAHFGYTLAGVGNDRILIGVPGDNIYDGAGGGVGGSAYLFDTNGAVVTAFTNPLQRLGDNFGCTVAALDAGRVLIGSSGANLGTTNAGAAYLFNTNGTLLTTFTNPPATPHDHFGFSVSAVGTNLILVGAPQDDTGAESAGSAYLFDERWPTRPVEAGLHDG